MNILLCNGKGGTGKTTLTVLLAHALAEAGKQVAVLDRDPQGTASKWVQSCEGGKVLLYQRGKEYDAVFIDSAPRLDSLPDVVRLCDVAVIVSSPSPTDLWTSQQTAETVSKHLTGSSRMRLLFNGVMPNTLLSRELPDLAQRINAQALKTTIGRRQCYQHAALLGWKALSTDAREELFKAAIEIVTK